jgi:hypothetical protein
MKSSYFVRQGLYLLDQQLWLLVPFPNYIRSNFIRIIAVNLPLSSILFIYLYIFLIVDGIVPAKDNPAFHAVCTAVHFAHHNSKGDIGTIIDIYSLYRDFSWCNLILLESEIYQDSD